MDTDVIGVMIPPKNAQGAFLAPSSSRFLLTAEGSRLQLQYTSEGHSRNIQGYTDQSVILKYMSLYVSKVHDAATAECMYSSNITGFQAAQSFLHHQQQPLRTARGRTRQAQSMLQ